MRSIRDQASAIARECGVDEGVVIDIRLAVTEVATNAVMHAYGQGPGPDGAADEIRLQAFRTADELIFVIADDGSGFEPRVGSPGAGLGLPIVAATTSRLELRSPAGGGTEVHLGFPCPGSPCAPAAR